MCVMFFCDKFGFNICNTDFICFRTNKKSSFACFKDRLEVKLQCGPVYQILYKSPFLFDNNQVKFYQLKVRDDDDVRNMFRTHEQSRFNETELYVLLQQPDQSQVVDPSQDFEEEDESDEDNHPEVDVIDQEEEDDEAMIDFMVNDDAADQEHEPGGR